MTNCYENFNKQASVNIIDSSETRLTTLVGQSDKQSNSRPTIATEGELTKQSQTGKSAKFDKEDN